MKTNKYRYLKVIQQHYGQGWEDVSEYEAYSTGLPMELTTNKEGKTETLFKHDIREYRLTGYATRAINRKELN